VPVDSAGNLIGLLAVESARPAAYDQDSVTLLRTLAGSVSAIIQNTLLLEQLQTTNTRLREMDRLKSQFLASMSHELRTPLNSIIGFSRVMLKGIDGPLTDMQEQDLQTIYTSGNHLLNLINDILDQAKIEANELNLKFAYFRIPDMVESVKSIAIGMMKDKPLTLDVEVGNNLPDAYGDEFRTRQILLNLVSNAIKFTQEGGIVLRAFAVENPEGDRMIQMEVEDTGIGIAESDMPILFEQFRQVDSSLTRTVGGTGLGLPISKSLTELQGGEMYVESEVNVGSTFAFTIPTTEGAEEELEARKLEKQREAKSLPKTPGNGTDDSQSGLIRKEDVERARQMHAESQAAQSNGGTQADAPADGKNKKPRPGITQNIPMMSDKREVVLIEDSKDMVDQFRRTLQREGFEVTTAEHPAYAEAMIGQLRPGVVILDVNFADGQGWNVLKNLKERDDTFDIPVIVTTMSEDSERAYRLGAHTFIERPFLPDDLLEAVLKAEAESKRERILIIDDQPEAIRLLRQLLDEHGDFRIFSAESGDEGISLVARRHPDLIILDLRMPDKDGFAVLDELRDNPETAKIPVLVVTGDVDLSATELEKLQDIDILQKTDISEADYDKFMDNVRAYLEANQ
jgi:signal transduction histidine kinase/CheY-like chemotaxis protein